jgi:hypothetical protein
VSAAIEALMEERSTWPADYDKLYNAAWHGAERSCDGADSILKFCKTIDTALRRLGVKVMPVYDLEEEVGSTVVPL